MKNIVSIVVYAVICRITHGGELELFFDDLTPINNDDQFVVDQGLSVTLVCIVPFFAVDPPTITKLIGSTQEQLGQDLVKNGILVSSESGKYEFQFHDNIYRLTINEVTDDDTADYICQSVELGGFFPFVFRYFHTATVQLVVQPTRQLPVPMCFENSLSRGIYFVGEDIGVICLIVRSGDGDHHDDDDDDDDDDNNSQEEDLFDDIADFRVDLISNNNEDTKLLPDQTLLLQSPSDRNLHYHKLVYKVANVDETYNGTSIVCYQEGDKSNENFCSHLPSWKIYRRLTVSLEPTFVTIQNGDSVTFTCSSIPGDTSNVDWMISEGDHMIRSFTTWQTSRGSMLMLENIQFAKEGNEEFKVACNVIFGTMNVSKHGLCSLRNDDFTTMILNTEGDGFADERSAAFSVAFVVIPIVVVIILISIATIVLVIFIKNKQIFRSKYIGEQVDSNIKIDSSFKSQTESNEQYDKIKDDNKLIVKEPADAQYTEVDYGHINGTTADASNEYTYGSDVPSGDVPIRTETQFDVRLGYSYGTEQNETSLSDSIALGLSRDESESVRNIIYEPYD